MYHSIFTNKNQEYTEKYQVYQTYITLIKNPKPYDVMSKKDIILECLRFYMNNNIIFIQLYSDEELDQLIEDMELKYSNYPLIHSLRNYFFCSMSNIDDEDFSISFETKDIVLESIEYYKQNKEQIKKEKYYEYFIVGLFRSYGLLTLDELIFLFNKYNINVIPFTLLNKYYVKRFIMQSSTKKDLYCLYPLIGREEEMYKKRKYIDDIIYSIEDIVERGKHYFIEEGYKYKVASSMDSFFFFKNSLPMDELIVDIGMDETITYAFEFVDDLCEEVNISPDEKTLFYDLLYDLPSFVFDSYNDKLDQKDVTKFYKLFYPFVDFCAAKFGVPLIGDIHQENIFIIFSKLVKTKFKIIDDFIENNDFNEEEKEILLGFKRFKAGPFLIIENEIDGSIFFDRDQFYLVKGLDQSVEVALQLDPPRFAETILVPFKDHIIYFAMLKSWDGNFDQVSLIRLQKSYEALKSTVIKKI